MGKYNLGKVTKEVSSRIDKKNLYVNEKKAEPIVKDMEKQLTRIRASLLKINLLLNESTSSKMVKGSRATVFKGWAKKAKSQATTAENLKVLLEASYKHDVDKYPIKMLDDRIAELEKRIMALTK